MEHKVKKFIVCSSGVLLLAFMYGLCMGAGHSYAGAETEILRRTVGCIETARVALPSSRIARALSPAEECGLVPTDIFKECDVCPEMVVVPSGSFEMGASERESPELADLRANRRNAHLELGGHEWPKHQVRFVKPFAVGRFAVTFDDWDACVADGGCGGYHPSDAGRFSRRGSQPSGWGRGRQPVINISWYDAQEYALWLSGKTGHRYRLLSEADREYVTRAG